MKKRTTRCILTALAFALIMLLPLQGFASEPVDYSKENSLTITYIENDIPLMDAQVNLYQVAVVTEPDTYVPTDAFDGLIYPRQLESEDMLPMATMLSAYTDLYEIASYRSAKTDDSGLLTFSGLPAGLYLVTTEKHEQDGVTYTSNPFLVYLPCLDPSTFEWVYDVAANAKIESYEDEELTVECGVMKFWEEDDTEHPESVQVYLLRDGEIYGDPVTLSEENRWCYKWTDLEAGHIWTVAEKVPEGYVPKLTMEGNVFQILNQTEPKETEPTEPTKPTNPTTPTTPPKLPQTGQLWWPVPVLAVVGMVIFLAGYLRSRGKDDET